MCSIATNATADKQLQSLKSSGDEAKVEKKLRDFAGNSNVQRSGILDSTANHIYGMPDDLKYIHQQSLGSASTPSLDDPRNQTRPNDLVFLSDPH